MRMVERKQDALSTNFLIGLMDDAPKKRVAEQTLHVDVRRQPKVTGDRTLEHLASRIVEEVTVSSSPRQLATQVLNQAGIQTNAKPQRTTNAHLRHAGQPSTKIQQIPTRRIRRVKRTTPVVRTPARRRGPPTQTRSRPAVGGEHAAAPAPRKVAANRKKQSRRGMFRR
jgi:hypothetical protein